jgi:hypothetical protein
MADIQISDYKKYQAYHLEYQRKRYESPEFVEHKMAYQVVKKLTEGRPVRKSSILKHLPAIHKYISDNHRHDVYVQLMDIMK